MDSFYDVEGAASELEKIGQSRKERSMLFEDAQPHLADLNTDAYSVVESGMSRKNWRLCTFEDEDEVGTEVIFTLQGVLSKCNLVPRHAKDCKLNQVIKLSQFAEICGLGTSLFDDSMTSATVVHDRFAQYFCGTPVSKWQPEVSPIGTVFSASNRLFTFKTDAPTEQGREFEPGVDPVGILERFKTADIFHAPENVVKYFRTVSDQERGETKHLQSFPGAFRVGDLVEMQASFVAIMTTQGQIKVTTRLHALTLLDTSFTYEADKKRMTFQSRTAVIQKQVKRKIGYLHEMGEHPRKKVQGDRWEDMRQPSMG
ncbi:hypothetical protein B0H16DRAFT_1481016 [Mycena metata]|uniref:Uncharacterized protein n=1 Tax=Mycena metata TaxID=1033252 RepID=A0AAD7MBI6_9AGAR|nr:hypothetical protein B0H16DRAFT_1481016 [Mycena metata]